MDYSLGTPAHTLVLATADEFSDSYQHVIEEVLMSDSHQGGTVNSNVVSDMVYLTYPNGGSGLLGGVYKLVREPILRQLRKQCFPGHR